MMLALLVIFSYKIAKHRQLILGEINKYSFFNAQNKKIMDSLPFTLYSNQIIYLPSIAKRNNILSDRIKLSLQDTT